MKILIKIVPLLLLISMIISGWALNGSHSLAQASDYNKSTTQENPETIESLRNKIDSIDKEILVLLNERAEAAVEIGKLKEEEGLSVYNPGREKVIEERLKKENPGPLPDSSVIKIYKEIIAACRAVQY